MHDDVTLTEAQADAARRAIDSIQSGRKLFRIGGYAGTGKTTIAKWIVREVNRTGRVAVCAYTGKAASVLRAKGLDAATIHRTMYNYDPDERVFHRKAMIDGTCVLVDEGSMVGQEHWDDLCSFGLPTVVIGDPGQLEPIGNDPKLMHKPDVVLEEIHRQARQSTIVEFADKVRHKQPFRHGTKGEVAIGPQKLFWESLEWADVLLCGFNRTRVKANDAIRNLRKRKGILEAGEKIVVLKNVRELGVFNGMILEVESVGRFDRQGIAECKAIGDDGTEYQFPLWKGAFGKEKPPNIFDAGNISKADCFEIVQADYGYCVTTHKAQGSEWGKVAVMDEQCNAWDAVRWRYTAVTRASELLRLCISI